MLLFLVLRPPCRRDSGHFGDVFATRHKPLVLLAKLRTAAKWVYRAPFEVLTTAFRSMFRNEAFSGLEISLSSQFGLFGASPRYSPQAFGFVGEISNGRKMGVQSSV